MQDHDLAGAARPLCAPVVKDLHAAKRQSDGVGFVAMQVVGMPAKARVQPLQAAMRFVEANLVRRIHAQTFKTDRPTCLISTA
jgi:hypothetical protein